MAIILIIIQIKNEKDKNREIIDPSKVNWNKSPHHRRPIAGGILGIMLLPIYLIYTYQKINMTYSVIIAIILTILWYIIFIKIYPIDIIIGKHEIGRQAKYEEKNK